MRAPVRFLVAALPLLLGAAAIPTLLAAAQGAQSIPGGAVAADSSAPGPNLMLPHAEAPTLHAAPLVGSIHVDGHLDDAAWQNATPVDHFTQRQPDEGKPCSERTEVRALVGDDALFIGARLWDKDAKKIRSRLVRRDDDLGSDYLA